MSTGWFDLLAIITELAGPEAAGRIDRRARIELGGLRVTVGARGPLTREDVDAVAHGRPKEAAKRLGVHQSTVYRALRRRAADGVR